MDRSSPVARLLESRQIGAWLLGAAVLTVGLHTALDPVWDADLGWLLRAGRDVLATHWVPTRNAYSFTEPQHPWVMHEWLSGTVYAAITARAGPGMLALARIAALGVTAWALAWRAGRDATGVVGGTSVAVALAVYGGRLGSPRPVGMAYALAAVTVAVAMDARMTWRGALLLGAVSCVWANAHGSFPLGVAVCLLGVATPGGDRRVRAGAAVLSALATRVNPYGWGMHGLVGRYTLADTTDAVAVAHARVLEWWPLTRAPWRVATAPELLLAAVLMGVWVLCLREARWRPRAVVCLALTAMAVQHNRHLALAGLLGLPLAAGPVAGWLGGAEGTPGTVPRLWLACVPGMLLALVVWAGAMAHRTPGTWVDPSRDDEDLAALVRALPGTARVYTSLPYTGFVIAQGRRVYWDSRNDCYGATVLREGFDVGDGLMPPAVADRVLRARGTTDAVVPCASRAARSLAAWHVAGRRGAFCWYQP